MSDDLAPVLKLIADRRSSERSGASARRANRRFRVTNEASLALRSTGETVLIFEADLLDVSCGGACVLTCCAEIFQVGTTLQADFSSLKGWGLKETQVCIKWIEEEKNTGSGFLMLGLEFMRAFDSIEQIAPAIDLE